MDNPVVSGAPAPGGKCRVCDSLLPDSLRCTRCGAAYGEANRCPHCGSVTDVERAGDLRFRCRVCGGPRVPVDDANVVRTGRELRLLERAQKARLRRAAWRVGAGVVGGFGALSLMVSLLVIVAVSPGVLASLAMLAAVAVPLVMAALAWTRAKQSSAELSRSLDEAWTLTASDVLAHGGAELTAEELGKVMRLEPSEAEELLARLNVNDFVHARVTDEGEVRYGTIPPGERIRVSSESEEESVPEEEQRALEARVPAPEPKPR